MDMGFNLNLEQKQSLVMTPQLQMAIELLQFSTQELEEYLEEQLKSNPLLERGEREPVEDNSYPSSPKEEYNYENFIAYQPNLLEYLEGQFYQVFSPEERKIARYIIGNLDERGFLSISTEEIAGSLNLSCNQVAGVLEKLHYLDPVGIGARDIQECLLIQLDSLSLEASTAKEIVRNYWLEFTQQDYGKIAQALHLEKGQLQQALNLIKTLNPYPAAGFARGHVKYIVPDLIVKEIKGRFIIINNEQTNPNLRINPYYYQILQQSKGNEVYQFLNQKYRAALWLIRSIEQRRVTIYRIAEAIVSRQEKFFRKGIKHLVPLTMQEIAEELELHESTVSRATTAKYLQTPQGLFELKFFFNRGVANLSSVSIKAIIKEWISGEDPEKPLSDSRIAKLLAEKKGMDISRRTVAKYRSELGIPPSTRRKKSGYQF